MGAEKKNTTNVAKYCIQCGSGEITILHNNLFECMQCGIKVHFRIITGLSWDLSGSDAFETVDEEVLEEDMDWEVDEEEDEMEDFPPIAVETCDWCGSPHVAYKDEAYTLCDFCAEQLFGD